MKGKVRRCIQIYEINNKTKQKQQLCDKQKQHQKQVAFKTAIFDHWSPAFFFENFVKPTQGQGGPLLFACDNIVFGPHFRTFFEFLC